MVDVSLNVWLETGARFRFQWAENLLENENSW